jgi:hypothetical protein
MFRSFAKYEEAYRLEPTANMTVLFTCPYCGTQTVVEDHYVGVSGPCVTCAKMVTVTPDETMRRRPLDVSRLEDATRSVRMMLVVLMLAAVGGSIVIWSFATLIAPEVGRRRSRELEARCRANLARIGVALQAYHTDHGSFPPAVVYDANGKPAHSWRVLLLPYLGEGELFARYNMQEPWDGPMNSYLLTLMPEVYADPADPSARAGGETPYLAVCGGNTAFPLKASVSEREMTDGLDQTVMVVESSASSVSWLQPVDLQVTRMSFMINAAPGNSIRSLHSVGPHILLADGTVRQLRTDAPPSELRNLTTIDGGETVRWKAVAEDPAP